MVGSQHKITLKGSEEAVEAGLSIKVGGDKNNIRLLNGNLPHQNDFEGKNFELNNLSNFPVVLSNKSSGISVTSCGLVTDNGTNNNITQSDDCAGVVTFTPDPTKKYYLDVLKHNVRLAANGETEAPYTTTINTTGDDVEWQFVAKGNGYWHLQRAAGGTKPRLRTDNSSSADMQPTDWNGVYTYYEITEGAANDTYFLTLPDGPTNYKRLQVDANGNVNMVPSSSAGSWESFTITPVETNKIVHIRKRNATGFALDGGNNGSDGQDVYLWTANENNINQQWIEIDRGNGYYSYKKLGTNYCIDGNRSGATNQNVYLWSCNDTNQNQQWKKVAMGNGAYKLIKRNASGFAIDGGSGGSNGQSIELWDSSSNHENLQWIITPISGTKAPESSEDETIIAYPNPVANKFTIQSVENSIVRIYDMNGKMVFTKYISEDSETIDISSFAQGLYYLKVNTSKSIRTIKISKQ